VLPQTRRGMIGLCAAVGSTNHAPPFGGSDLLLGTNPIAIAVPAGEQPSVVRNMATTVAVVGKIKTLAQRGESMPEGWMVGRDGRPLTDPTRREEGFPPADRRRQGLRPGTGDRPSGRRPQRRGLDVVDFTGEPHQYRPSWSRRPGWRPSRA
jgi:LDH2 family malate/lactate/ureidoglycolate dehydrogenase